MEDLEKLLFLAKTQKNKLSKYSLEDCCQGINEYITLKELLTNEGVEILESDVDPEFGIDTPSPFDPKKLDVVPAKITLDSICKRIKNNEIDLNPPFQRKAGIWDDERKSRLIESILIKIPLPTFYVDATDNDRWIVIDGLQRLTTIKNFVVDKTLKLSKLEFLDKELGGCSFDGIGRKHQRQIEETEINICKLVPPTPSEVKYVIFKRLNTGGIRLEDQEIRNALFQGAAVDLLNEMSQVGLFKTMVGNSTNVSRMEDKEFCLRYIAYVLLSDEVISDSDKFLNKTMEKFNLKFKSMTDEDKRKEFNQIKKDFEQDLQRAYDLFDKYAFKKIINDNRRALINKYLFQSWLFNLHQLSSEQFIIIFANKDKLIKGFEKFCLSEDYSGIMRSKDKTSIIVRNEKIKELIFNEIK